MLATAPLVVGSIAIVDLRLLGLASLDRALTRLTANVLPCTWVAFVWPRLPACCSFLPMLPATRTIPIFRRNSFFSVGRHQYGGLSFLVARGYRKLGNLASHYPVAGQDCGRRTSLLIWIGVVACGRWVGFTLHPTALGG